MPMPTALDRYCDEYWETTKLDEFLDCVAGKLAEKLQKKHPDLDIEAAVNEMHWHATGPLADAMDKVVSKLVTKIPDHLD